MSPQDFVSKLYSAVVVENNSIYRDIFGSTAESEASDPYWKRALSLFSSLNSEEKGILFEIMRQVSVDTTANVLGIIDGANSLEGVEERFNLVAGNAAIDGDLQSLFLVEDEHMRK